MLSVALLLRLCTIACHACRLLTLAGLRRRGVAPESINAFCREIGITRNANVIPHHKLEHHVRLHLDVNSPRTLAVLRPLKVWFLFVLCCGWLLFSDTNCVVY
jgi:glutamyl/glutaminyl-tRNA synthetase